MRGLSYVLSILTLAVSVGLAIWYSVASFGSGDKGFSLGYVLLLMLAAPFVSYGVYALFSCEGGEGEEESGGIIRRVSKSLCPKCGENLYKGARVSGRQVSKWVECRNERCQLYAEKQDYKIKEITP